MPGRGREIGRQEALHRLEGQLVDDLRIEPRKFRLVELRRSAAERGKVEALDERIHFDERLHRLAGPEPGEQRDDRHRLVALRSKGVAAERPEPLRQLALLPHQQRLMGETRDLPLAPDSDQRGEHLDLHCSVADVILAPQHVGDTHGEIVDRARQHVEPATVGPAHDRIGQLGRIETLRAAHTVVPRNGLAVVEPEAPMRRDALGLLRRPLRVAQRQCRAVVDWRQAPAELDLALKVEFLRGFIGRIDAPGCFQRLERRLVLRQPFGLAFLAVRYEAEPGEIGADGVDIFLAAALCIGVVDPQQEPPAALFRQQPIMQRSADIADMKPPRGRGGEAGDRGHARADSRGGRRMRARSRAGQATRSSRRRNTASRALR